MRYYCPRCWRDFSEDVTRCPQCSIDIAEFLKGKDYVEKLIIALGHPEPKTPIRAAWTLGKLGDERAVEPLIGLIEKTEDVYTACAAVTALARLGTARARRFLRGIAFSHPAAMVRDTATQGLVNLAGRGKTRSNPT
jgi:HEAT repeat protein